MTSDSEQPVLPARRVFQSSFWRPFVPICILLVVVGLVVGFTVRPANIEMGTLVLAILVGSALGAAPMAFSTWYYRTDVDSAGIGGYNLWNVYGRVNWSDISEVKRVDLLPGITYF